MRYLLIFAASGTGGLARYALSRLIQTALPGSFPAGTFTVNMIGCFLAGLLAASFERWVIPPDLRLLVFAGFLGGFTTFSAFALETASLFKGAEWRIAGLNLLLTNLCGVALVIAGFLVFQSIVKAFK
jgi:CrcB protein